MNLIKKKSVLAILVNILILLTVSLICSAKYEVSDDFVMETILSGAYTGTVNPNLLYMNVIYGHILNLFYTIFAGVSWYFVCLLLFGCCGFITITYFLLDRYSYVKGLILSVFVIIFMLDDIYVLVQFTKTAAFIVSIGSMSFLYGSIEKKCSKKYLVIGAILIIVGSWIRFSVLYIVGPFVLMTLLCEFIKLYRVNRNWQLFVREIKSTILWGCVIITLIWMCEGYDEWSRNQNQADAQWQTFNSARADFVDYPSFDYESNQQLYQEINVSENDFFMAQTWQFGDVDFFTTEKFEDLNNVLEISRANEKKISFEKIYYTAWKMKERHYEKYYISWAIGILFILGILGKKTNVIYIALSAGVGVGLLFYFHIIGRVVYRVEYGILCTLFMSMLYLFEFESYKIQCLLKSKIVQVVFVGLVVFRCILFLPQKIPFEISDEEYWKMMNDTFLLSSDFNGDKYRTVTSERLIQGDLIAEMENNSNNIYFMDFNATIQTLYLDYSPWMSLPKGYFANKLYFAGVTTHHPEMNQVLETQGIDNPMIALLEKDVYLVDRTRMEYKEKFLKEHYSDDIKGELYKEIDGYKIWKFSDKER